MLRFCPQAQLSCSSFLNSKKHFRSKTAQKIKNMGNANFTKRQRFPILMSGLEGVGKTTIAFRLSLNKTVTTVPTVSFESVPVKSELFKFDVQDLGGQTMLYHLWPLYYKNATGIVYVVDSSGEELAMRASARLLKDMLSHQDLKNVPLLILANKQDLEWSKSVEEISNILNLKSIENRPVHITECCGITGDGLSDAMRWLYVVVLSIERQDNEQSKQSSKHP